MRFWLFLPLVLFLNIILSSCSTDTVTRITDDLKDVKIQNNSEIGLLGSDNQFVDEPRKTRQDSFPRFTVNHEESGNNNTKKIVNVAILLPLSGPSANIGQSILSSATMALFDISDNYFRLLPYDTEGTPEGAQRASEQAILDGAMLILGPVFSSSAKAITTYIRRSNLVMIPFTTDPTVARPGVFILGFLVHEQVRRIINFGISQNIFRYAVLAPGTPYGETVVDTAQQVIEQAGAELTKIAYYDPSGSNLNEVVRSFADYDRRHNSLKKQRDLLKDKEDAISLAALKRLEQLDTIGDVPYDAILIPESGGRLTEVAALLPYYDVDPGRVQLMGTLLWHISGLGKEPSLVGGWYPAPSPKQNLDFYNRFKEIYGYKPPAISTHGYDAVALASILSRTHRINPFDEKNFFSPNGFSGVDGVFRFTKTGLSERGFAILEVTRNSAAIIDVAPLTFEKK
ncbi:MAG: penicillin-binding protein activator [Pseudomonadota bacterium]|nr:penicillin-binding protein activator [Pseudomonadota bacterium]